MIIKSAVIVNDIPISSREIILNNFNKGKFNILISVDDANEILKSDSKNINKNPGILRGIDFKNVRTVVNYEFPKNI